MAGVNGICPECRKNKGLDTWRDKIADFFAYRIFPKTIKNERSNASLQGFTEGYKIGFKQAKDNLWELRKLEELYKDINDIPKV